MIGWLGINSRGTVTTGIAARMGGNAPLATNGCISQGLGCIAASLWLVLLAFLCWFIVAFVGGMLGA
jgi:hypothetical protein